MNINVVDWSDLKSVLRYCDYLNNTYGKYRIYDFNPTVVVRYPNKDYYQIMHYKRALDLENKRVLEIIKQSIPNK